MSEYSNVQKAILQTLIYADLFDYPLTAEEVRRRLNKKKTTVDKVNRSLKKLLDQGKLKKQDQFYFLPGEKKSVRLRKKRNKISQRKVERAKKVAQLLKIIPSIKLVGLTGSVAAGNAEEKDDLDFLIITSSGWLWLTRFLTTCLLTIFALRRRPGDKQYKNKVCLNLFLEQGYLDAFAENKNLFLAYEVVLMEPIWQRGEIYEQFLGSNSWAEEFLPNAFDWEEKEIRKSKPNRFVELIDLIFFKCQKWLMRKRKTREKVEPHLIAFHPKDLSKSVLKKYKQRLKNI